MFFVFKIYKMCVFVVTGVVILGIHVLRIPGFRCSWRWISPEGPCFLGFIHQFIHVEGIPCEPFKKTQFSVSHWKSSADFSVTALIVFLPSMLLSLDWALMVSNSISQWNLQLSSFEFFHLKSLRCLKKINDIFRSKGIFDFLHLQFDTVRAQSDGSGMDGKKKIGAVVLKKTAELFQEHTENITIFFNGTMRIPHLYFYISHSCFLITSHLFYFSLIMRLTEEFTR